ncbi:zinc finger BED domain-containing protein 1-like [Rhizophagus clarus]|uniref:Zinc finger BED domain-containing protein 1-like n=1 Tax=Rhizophagus clarus TaxID=94130 RepID=A0A8H3M4H1_9GLOM|nr:zinc finger BED domain-containing protein 1-like [Rhizophagus clarus]
MSLILIHPNTYKIILKQLFQKEKWIFMEELVNLLRLFEEAITFLSNAAFLDPRFKDLTFARSEKDQIICLIQDELNFANQVRNPLLEDNSNNENQEINDMEVIEQTGESAVINILIEGLRNLYCQKEKNTLFSHIFSNSSNTNTLENELTQYVSIKCVNSNVDLCKWWVEKKILFLSLFDFTQKYFHIPATSISSERLFQILKTIFQLIKHTLTPSFSQYGIFKEKYKSNGYIFT